MFSQETFAKLIEASKVYSTPWPYMYIENVFDPFFYEKMIDCLPNKDLYPSDELYYSAKEVYRHAFSIENAKKYGAQIHEISEKLRVQFNSSEILDVLKKKFPASINQPWTDSSNVYARAVFTYDKPGYDLKPHTDVIQKVFTFLFYMPKDHVETLEGTTLLVPKLKGFTSNGYGQYRLDDFNIVKTLPFRPNSLLIFHRTNLSWHCKLKSQYANRYMLQLNYNSKIEDRNVGKLISFWEKST